MPDVVVILQGKPVVDQADFNVTCARVTIANREYLKLFYSMISRDEKN